MRNKIILTCAFFAFAFASFAKTYNIKDFGAIGDGETINTVAIQKAIDTCSENGGGTIIVPEGEFVIGTIVLKSNICLSLSYNSFLLGSTNQADYRTDITKTREDQVETLFFAENSTNITIEGLGTVNGRGSREAFPRNKDKAKDTRPRLFRLENCKNLKFSGCTYRDPAFWGFHLVDCKNVLFTGVTIRFRYNNYNNDGMDLDGCENLTVENCDIISGDDAICLKSTLNPCRNITVRNCMISSGTAPLKLGTSSAGGFINVDVSNCYFYDAPMGAIKLQLVDGGILENINIYRIKMQNVGCPIFIRLGNRAKQFYADKPDEFNGPMGSAKNITISDIDAFVTPFNIDRSKGHKKENVAEITTDASNLTKQQKSWTGPIMITGIPNHYIENVSLNNVKISFLGGGNAEDAKNVVAEDETRYPEQFFFGVLPAWGAYIRHAKNVTFNNVVLETRQADAREMIILDDVENFQNIK